MKVKDFVLKKREEEKGPRDFHISDYTHNKFLSPISEELKKFSVEGREIILFAILLSAKKRKLDSGKSNFSHKIKEEREGPPKAVISIIELDSEKIEFLLSIMIYLFGVESIFNYKEMIKTLEELAEEGLDILYNKFTNDYLNSPSKFADEIFNGKL